MQHKRYVFVCMWFWSCQRAFMMCWFSCLFPLWNSSQWAGVAMCASNSPSVSCVSVQSSNTTGRVKRPQADAISEYVYSGVNQNLNRACRPHCFPVFLNLIFSLHDYHANIFAHGIILSGVQFTLCWGCHRVSRFDSNWEGTCWFL